MESVVRFKCDKDEVFGILHRPERTVPDPVRRGVLFLNSGLRYRIGPSRQFVRFARNLCRAGFYVLRFDMPGIGDSEGQIREPTDFRPLIAENVSHTQQAIDFFAQETGIEGVTLLGLCGGAFNALLTGAVDPRVESLLLLSLPIEELGDFSEKTYLRVSLDQYFRKLLSWRAWMNLLLLRTKFRWMFKALGQMRKGRFNRDFVDETLWDAFESTMCNGKRIFFFYGELDPFYQAFTAGFGQRLAKRLPQEQANYEICVLERADHVFSQRSWQNLIIQKSIAWMHAGIQSKSIQSDKGLKGGFVE